MRALAFALAALTGVTAGAMAQTASDEPNVQRGRVETFGPKGRLFSAGPTGRFFLLSRQSFTAEHGAGYTGDFRIVTDGTMPAEWRLGYEIICNSVRAGYRSVQVIDRDKATQDTSPASGPRTGAAKEVQNLYWAACRSRFLRFR